MLNSSELAALRLIESGLALEDPRLAERLATGRLRTPLGRRLGLLVLLLGGVGLLVGMSVLSGALVVASLVLATLGGTAWLWASGMVPRRLPGA
jgi:protein-S-isoprenylcysteine O-methyltransferase Ste14